MGLSSTLGSAVGALPAGAVIPYAGSAAPAGWLLCGGQAVSRSDYAALFAIIGTTYGAGNGSTTFNLPDLRGRVVAGEDDMGGTAANRLTSGNSGITGTTLGAAGGDERLHQHQHANTAAFTGTAGTTGSGSAHSHANTLSNATVAPSNHQHAETIMHSTTTGSNGITPYAPWNDPVFGIWSTAYTFANRQGFSMAGPEGTGATGYPHLTSGPLSSTTVGITNANESAHTHGFTPAGTVAVTNVNAGAGSSQNVQPTMIMNYIIKAVAY